MAEKKSSVRVETPKSTKYTIEGGKVTRKNKFCPRCGIGVFLARHKDRMNCGQCNYTEFDKKNSDEAPKSADPKEEKPEVKEEKKLEAPKEEVKPEDAPKE